jgi:hypothetical protein
MLWLMTQPKTSKTALDRNVGHLEIMVAKDFWTSEDMTAANAAIVAGNAYTA